MLRTLLGRLSVVFYDIILASLEVLARAGDRLGQIAEHAVSNGVIGKMAF